MQARAVKTGRARRRILAHRAGTEARRRVIVEGLLTVRPGVVVHPVPYREKPVDRPAAEEHD